MFSAIRIPLSEILRCGPYFCSMRIIEDVRRYAAEKNLSDEAAIKQGLEEKAAEFAKGGEVYQKV
jgi:phosphomethylpyrimidine synthase